MANGLIGLNANPATALTAPQRRQLAVLDGMTVNIGAPGTPCDAIDIEGTYAKWFEDLDAKYALLRPDFYVAITAKTPEALQQRFDKIMGELHLQTACAEAAALV